ncbi:MAG: hypothetical protein JWO83_1295 [Caulobacteraceae bacterium]|nr:hypothetical protein [Caulobacteraceae bacterium]
MRALARRAWMVAATLAVGVAASVPAATPMSDAELDDVRGGFVTAGGITFGFGAVEKTYVDGRLALLTTLTLGDNGAIASLTTAGPGLTAADPALAARLGLAAGGAFSLGGAVTLAQGVSGNQLLNLVINTASNKVIRQDTAVNLVLPNFTQLSRSAAMFQTSAGLSSGLNAATLGAVTH